jgi:hypothetical protein
MLLLDTFEVEKHHVLVGSYGESSICMMGRGHGEEGYIS